MQNLKGHEQIDLFTKQKQTDSERMNLWLPGARKGRRTVRELEMDMYKLLHLKWIMSKDMAHETLFNVVWQPGWEGSLGETGYMDMYG